MQLYVNGKSAGRLAAPLNENDVAVVVASYEEVGEIIHELGFDVLADPVNDLKSSTHYENHRFYDFLYINKPALTFDCNEISCNASVFFNPTRLAVFTNDKNLIDSLLEVLAKKSENVSPVDVLYQFFTVLSANDSTSLDDIEDHLVKMESRLMEGHYWNTTPSLFEVRKKLLVLKRYYEAMVDLMQDMEENPDGYFTHQQLARLRIYTNKADRLYNQVNNLREYATQVREAYQNQIDISQNEIMKLFTVITAIFLPLTLIVGWYGMNLKMPEFEYDFMYPMVILASITVVVAMLAYFKKKKWF